MEKKTSCFHDFKTLKHKNMHVSMPFRAYYILYPPPPHYIIIVKVY